MRRNKSEHEDDEDFDLDKDFRVSSATTENGNRVFNIYLFGAIMSPSQFIPSISCLQAASEEDVVFVHIQTPGGNIDATDTFITAMECCRAPITFIATGGVHSAGSIILMHAENIILSDRFNCLIHNGSTLQGGKFSDFTKSVEFHVARTAKLLRGVYAGFLTEEEIDSVIAGQDIWLDAESFEQRLEKRQKFFEKAVDKA